MITISARAFNQDVSAAKRAAASTPVVITDRGEPAFVLLSYAEYERLSGPRQTLVDVFAADDDIEFDLPEDRIAEFREIEW